MTDDIWTVGRILGWIEDYLGRHDDENPRLSAQWLVSEALGVSRIQLYADLERPLSLDERDVLRDWTRRRGTGEPLQYLTGSTDFRFITVKVAPGVLIPRPETEVLVSEAFAELKERLDAVRPGRAVLRGDFAEDASDASRGSDADGDDAARGGETPDAAPASAPEPFRAVDLCTGSGCIACSIAREVPGSFVIATDIAPEAVALAQDNADSLGVAGRVTVVECDLAAAVPSEWEGAVDLVISNPPYIPTAVLSQLPAEVVAHEPALALDGGADGLDLFRRILPEALRLLAPGGALAVELHETCLDAACDLAESAGFSSVRIAVDLAGRPRVLVARKSDKEFE